MTTPPMAESAASSRHSREQYHHQQQPRPHHHQHRDSAVLSPEPQRVWQYPPVQSASPSSHHSHRLSYPPRAYILEPHQSPSRKSHSYEHGSPPRNHSSQRRHSSNKRRQSSTYGKDGHEIRSHRTNDSRRNSPTEGHQTHIAYARASQPRSHERLYDPESGTNVVVGDEDDDEELAPRELLRAMLLMSAPVPLLSFVLCIYSVPIIFLALLLSPLRLCIRSMDSFSVRMQKQLLPPLNLQRKWMRLPPIHFRSHHSTSLGGVAKSSSQSPCSTESLLFMHLFSPIVSALLAFAAWVTSFAWLCSGALNHESIQDVSKGERRMATRLFSIWLDYLSWPLEEGIELEIWEEDDRKQVVQRMPEVVEIKTPSV